MIENCRFASFPCDMDWIMMKETPFEKTKCLIILSEDIMNRGESIAIIATPLAHIWLKHDVSYLAPRDSEGDFDQKQFDKETMELLEKWGFKADRRNITDVRTFWKRLWRIFCLIVVVFGFVNCLLNARLFYATARLFVLRMD